jgi:hypothetical protein
MQKPLILLVAATRIKINWLTFPTSLQSDRQSVVRILSPRPVASTIRLPLAVAVLVCGRIVAGCTFVLEPKPVYWRVNFLRLALHSIAGSGKRDCNSQSTSMIKIKVAFGRITSGTPLARKQACPESPGLHDRQRAVCKTFIISLDYMQYCVHNASILGSEAVMNYIPGSSAEGP